MDTLTHGLLGAVVAAIPLPRSDRVDATAARAALLACVLAAELPDLDYLLPAQDAVLHTLRAHRGLTHSLIAAPLIALVAAVITKLIFRTARFAPIYLRALIAVPLAHLLPDLWTGWGTRLFLPFSADRMALDWTMVLDPWFTLPLLIAALWALRRRQHWRGILLYGAAISFLYLGARIASSAHLTSKVRESYSTAKEVHVFPAPLSVLRWRYVAEFDHEYRAGTIALAGELEEQARVDRTRKENLPFTTIPTIEEALAWARFPVVRTTELDQGARRIGVADLRYHLRGKPTLTFVVTVAADQRVTEAKLERGGSAAELFKRWRE